MIPLNKTEVAADIVYQLVDKQSGVKKYANTIAAFLATAGGVLTALAGVWVVTGQFPTVTAAFVAIAPFLTALAVRFTKNGISPSVQEKILDTARESDLRDEVKSSLNELRETLEHARQNLPVYRGPSSGAM